MFEIFYSKLEKIIFGWELELKLERFLVVWSSFEMLVVVIIKGMVNLFMLFKFMDLIL